MILTFDFETNTVKKGNPFTKSGKSISYSTKRDDGEVRFNYYTDIEYLSDLRNAFENATLVVGHNVKFDIHWARRHGVRLNPRARVWDTQIAEFLIRGQQGPYPSLNESLERFGLGRKDDKVAEYWSLGVDTQDIPVEELKTYNNLDVELTYQLYKTQLEYMPNKLKRLCYVMGLDSLVLEEMEWNGVKLDVEECEKKANETAKELEEVSEELGAFAPHKQINLGSGHHLSCFLYGGCFELVTVDRVERLVYKSGLKKGQEYDKTYWKTEVVECPALFTPIKGSQTKLVSKVDETEYPIYSTSEDVLKQLKCPTKKHKRIIELLLKRAELEKLLSTYYEALPKLLEEMEWEDQLLHGQYNQVVARTGRLSSSAPNMQNAAGAVDELLVSRF